MTDPTRRNVLAAGGAALVAACGPTFRVYNGPEVTRIVVQKADRRLFLMHEDQVIRAFDVDLGFAPVGPKQFSGDGRTPEGSYFIDRKNPRSAYHLSVGISYPNAEDVAFARSLGREAGGDIFIHGAKNPFARKGVDWTAGCISVSNREIEDIYAMVDLGTQIDINP